MSKPISQETNLILQSYCNVVLIKELAKDKNLVNSDYFKNLKFDDPNIKIILNDINIDNQGALLMSLYALFVIPKELIFAQQPTEFENVNTYLEKNTTDTITTYPNDSPKVNFVNHLRNSIAHAKVVFNPNKTVTFNDDYNGKSFSTTLELKKVGELMDQMQQIQIKYIRKQIE